MDLDNFVGIVGIKHHKKWHGSGIIIAPGYVLTIEVSISSFSDILVVHKTSNNEFRVQKIFHLQNGLSLLLMQQSFDEKISAGAMLGADLKVSYQPQQWNGEKIFVLGYSSKVYGEIVSGQINELHYSLQGESEPRAIIGKLDGNKIDILGVHKKGSKGVSITLEIMKKIYQLIGENGRGYIRILDTNKWPWNIYGGLHYGIREGNKLYNGGMATATIIGPNHLLTVRHNLGETGTDYRKSLENYKAENRELVLTFYPSIEPNKGTTPPKERYYTKIEIDWEKTLLHKFWLNAKHDVFDNAILLILKQKVPSPLIANDLTLESENLKIGTCVHLAGYPGTYNGTMLYTKGIIIGQPQKPGSTDCIPSQFLYCKLFGTSPGASGSTIWFQQNNKRKIVGVLSGGSDHPDFKNSERVAPITLQSYREIQRWLQDINYQPPSGEMIKIECPSKVKEAVIGKSLSKKIENLCSLLSDGEQRVRKWAGRYLINMTNEAGSLIVEKLTPLISVGDQNNRAAFEAVMVIARVVKELLIKFPKINNMSDSDMRKFSVKQATEIVTKLEGQRESDVWESPAPIYEALGIIKKQLRHTREVTLSSYLILVDESHELLIGGMRVPLINNKARINIPQGTYKVTVINSQKYVSGVIIFGKKRRAFLAVVGEEIVEDFGMGNLRDRHGNPVDFQTMKIKD